MDPYISIGKESIEGESDDIFFETNKKEKKEEKSTYFNTIVMDKLLHYEIY